MITLRRGDYFFFFILISSLVLAWLLRHTEDDAFITFRYSRHLAEGIGAVWNPADSPPVEGYSNFLWMVLMAIPHLLGMEVVGFSQMLGLFFWGLNLWVSWRLIQLLIPSFLLRVVALAAIALNYTLLGYATGGMETSMNGFLCSLFFYGVINILMTRPFSLDKGSKASGAPSMRLGSLGLLSALLILSRHDNLIFVALALGLILVKGWKEGALSPRLLKFLIAPFILLSLLFFLRLSFYGQPLPNTFYVKGPGGDLSEGLFYVISFVLVYGLFIPLLLLLLRGLKHLGNNFVLSFLGCTVGLWMVYLVLIGGDYMEFRMWVPVIPVTIVGLACWLGIAGVRTSLNAALMGLLIVFSGAHAYAHSRLYQLRFVTAIHPAVSDSAPPYLSMVEQAHGIQQLLKGPLIFATGNCGAYAYYNDRIQWIDLYGLNDHWIARNGISRDFGPGHRLVAPFEHLVDRGTHLVSVACLHDSQLAEQRPYNNREASFDAVLAAYRPENGDANVRVLEIPVAQEFTLLCLYLHSHPDIEALINAGEIPAPKPLNFY